MLDQGLEYAFPTKEAALTVHAILRVLVLKEALKDKVRAWMLEDR
jgi:hypothetical protein